MNVFDVVVKVKRISKYAGSGTEAIKTQFQLSKPKQEITKITNSYQSRTNGPINAHLTLAQV